MPLTQPLPTLRKNIREILIEDLPAAIKALRELLPEGSEKHSMTLAMLAQINDANKARFRNTISEEDYARKIDTVRANLLDLLETLEEADFEAPLAATDGKTSGGRTGSVLYRVPHRMPLRKPVICTIRVAIDEDALLEDIVLDAEVRVKQRVEISDTMKAELLDPEGSVFQIRSLSEAMQLVRETGNTQWLFSVTPLVEGLHQLLVKVSMMEYVPNLNSYVPREVSILETVTIVTETAVTDEEEAPLKPTGESFAVSPSVQPQTEIGGGGHEQQQTHTGSNQPLSPSPSPPSVKEVTQPKPSWNPQKKEDAKESAMPPENNLVRQDAPVIEAPREHSPRPISGRMRALSFLLLFLVVGSTATYALTPPPVRDFWFAELSGSAAAYADYIQTYKDDPDYQNDPAIQERVEKAYFKKARKTEAIEDLRAYQQKYGEKGQYRREVAEKIRTLELRELDTIRRQPTGQRIRNFLKNYPESTELTTVAQAAATNEQVLQEVQPELDAVLEEKATKATTTEEIRALAPALKAAASSQSVERVEKIVAKKTQLQQSVQPQLQEIKAAVKARRNRQAGEMEEKEEESRPLIGQANEKLNEKKEAVTKKLENRKDKVDAKLNGLGNAVLSTSEKPMDESTKAVLKSIAEGMVLVKGGTFTMGCADGRDKKCNQNEKPTHQVTLNDFYLGRTEVTQAQWHAIMGQNPSLNKDCTSCPVEQVSWHDANEFIKKLNALSNADKYRLPSEAEWEYAARGGASTQGYFYSGGSILKDVAWYITNSNNSSHPVGKRKGNELGLFDMSGNVWEWCQDVWHGDYEHAPRTGGAWMTSGDQLLRVARGGAWGSKTDGCKPSTRYKVDLDVRSHYLGFRIAK